MPITDPTDIASVAHWYRSDVVTGSDWADRAGSDDLSGTIDGPTGGTAINGNTTLAFAGGSVEAVLASSISQPCDIFVVGITNNFAFTGTDQIIEPASSGTGHTLGWNADGGAGHRGRLYADCGSAVDAPQDGRVIEQIAYVYHLRANGASSEVRINGAYHWSGDFGSDALDGLKIGAAQFDYGEIVVTDGLLTDQEVGELLEYFNGYWGLPDWAPNRHRVALVASSATPADNTSYAQLRFAVEQRGHSVDYIASAALDATDLTPYAAVMYAGDYADRVANGPVVRASIDAGTPWWISLYEPGMAGAVTDTVAVQCDLVDEVQTAASFAFGSGVSVTTHPITDYLGTPPKTIGSKQEGTHALIDAADNAVGTLIAQNNGERTYAIDAGTADLSAVTIIPRVVMSGNEMSTGQYYFTTRNAEIYMQNMVDWLLDAISPPVINTVTSGLLLTAPKFGEIIDPLYDDVTFSWQGRAGRTATLEITSNITDAVPTWVTIATGLSATSHSVDMSDPATWPEGIWYSFRIVWDDALTWTHPGFKLLSVTVGSGFGHAFIDFEYVPGAGGSHTFAWAQTKAWWGGIGDYNGLAAKVLVGNESPSLAQPPGVPTGFKHYEISSYMRIGALTSPYVGQSTKYWASEGQGGGLGLYAKDPDIGIAFTVYPTQVFPLPPCPGKGRTNNVIASVRVKDGTSSNTVQTDTFTHPALQFHAFPSDCKLNDWLVPVRMLVIQAGPTTAEVFVGVAGNNGTSYWLIHQTLPFDFSNAGPSLGWVLSKIAGNQDAGGFRDMYSLSVSGANDEEILLPPGVEPEPSRPCVVQFDLYAPDRTTVEWSVTDDPGDAADVALLMELTNYGAQVVDFLNGSATLATITLGIIDPPTIPGDQDSGIITERIFDSVSRGAIRGRRGRLRRFISPTQGWVTIADGDCMEPYLNASYSSISFAIRDTRESERKTKAFQKGETTCLMPRGVLRQGVGPIALGSYIPNIEHSPLLATFKDEGSLLLYNNYYFDLQPHYWSGGSPTTNRVILLPAAEAAGEGRITSSLPDPFVPTSTILAFDFPKCIIWWRPVGGGTNDWTKLKPGYTHDTFAKGTIVERNLFTVADTTFNGRDVRAVQSIACRPLIFPLVAIPNVNDVVEILVQYVGPTTEDLPFHWAGELGEAIEAAYAGEFSPRLATFAPPTILGPSAEYDPGTPVDTGVRRDSAVLATMTEEVVIRVTEPVDKLRDWVEKNLFAPYGYAPALDRDGQVSPLHQRFPSSTVGLTTIDNSIAKAEPGWKVGTTIINLLEFKYGRLFANPVDEDGIPYGAVDGIQEQDVEVWYVAAGGNLPLAVTGPEFLAQVSDSVAQFGERTHTIEAGATKAVQAIDIAFDQTTEQAFILSTERAGTLLPRYAFGTEVIEIPVRREPTALLRAGDWIGVDLSWMPDKRTRRRGLKTYAQLFEVEDNNCAWRFFRAEVGEAINLLTYSGSSGSGSGGTAPFSSRVPIFLTGSSGSGSGGSAPYSTDVGGGFDPSDISGLVLDCRAEALEAALADMDPVSSWTDASGNGHHLTQSGTPRPTFREAADANGWSYLQFDGTDDFLDVPGAAVSGLTSAHVFIVLRSDADPGVSGKTGIWQFGSDAVTNDHHPFTDGILYNCFGSSARKTCGNPALDLTTVHIMSIHSAASDWQMKLNGSSQHSTTSNGVAWTANPKLGNNRTGQDWQGRIYAILIYNSKLSSMDEAAVLTYLAKYQSAR